MTPGDYLVATIGATPTNADMSGTIDAAELAAVRTKPIRLSTADKLIQLLNTHPSMLRRIKHLSALTAK